MERTRLWNPNIWVWILATCYQSGFGQISNISKPEWGFPGGSVVKESAGNAGDIGLIPESRRSLGGGNGSLLQCSWNPMARGAWWATVHAVAVRHGWVRARARTHTRLNVLICRKWYYPENMATVRTRWGNRITALVAQGLAVRPTREYWVRPLYCEQTDVKQAVPPTDPVWSWVR